MSQYVAYTSNTDGSINILAGSSNPNIFPAILPTGTEYKIHKGEIYHAGGKTWLSDTEEGYIEAKKEDEKEKALSDLDIQYNSDKAVLMSQYTEADIDGDSELKESIKAELVALREQYDKDYEDIVGGDE